MTDLAGLIAVAEDVIHRHGREGGDVGAHTVAMAVLELLEERQRLGEANDAVNAELDAARGDVRRLEEAFAELKPFGADVDWHREYGQVLVRVMRERDEARRVRDVGASGAQEVTVSPWRHGLCPFPDRDVTVCTGCSGRWPCVAAQYLPNRDLFALMKVHEAKYTLTGDSGEAKSSVAAKDRADRIAAAAVELFRAGVVTPLEPCLKLNNFGLGCLLPTHSSEQVCRFPERGGAA